MKVLLAGCDANVTALMQASIQLRQPNASMLHGETINQALEVLTSNLPDLVVLCWRRSHNGLTESIQDIREVSSVPIMVLGEDPDQMAIVSALTSGADEYVRIPCPVSEMMARIWALLRRSGHWCSERSNLPYHCGELVIDPAAFQAFLGDRQIKLTPTEFKFLHTMIQNFGNVVRSERLLQELPGRSADPSVLVKKYVQRLRVRLEDDVGDPRWIATVRGVGYRFVGPKPSRRVDEYLTNVMK